MKRILIFSLLASWEKIWNWYLALYQCFWSRVWFNIFSPIIFVGFNIRIIFYLSKKYFLFLLLGASYLIPFFSVIVLQNTGFSYGYRYLFVLIPLNIVIYFKYFQQNKLIKYWVFSILGLLGYILFETTEYTSLSQDYLINSFGMETRYSNPDYLTNLFKSISNINSYLHIIFTSFIGVLLIKIINLFMSPSQFFEYLQPLQ